MSQTKENRKEERIQIAFPVECFIHSDKADIFYTVSKNVSLEGMQIICGEKLPMGKNIKININLIKEIAETNAQVMWCNKGRSMERYYAGLKFLTLDGEDKDNLLNFIKKFHPV